MGEKAKFILVGFIGVAVVFIFLYLQTLNSKELIIKERDSLKDENVSLMSRIERINSDLRQAQDKASSLEGELDSVSQERNELERKYEAANRTKEELLEKMQSQATQAQGQRAAVQMEGISQRSDDYWASILTQNSELQMQLDNLRNELETARIKNEELLRDRNALERDMEGLKSQAEELQHQIEYNKKIMDSIAEELVWEKKGRFKAEEKIVPFKKDNALLARQLKGLDKQKMALEKKLQQLQQDKSGLVEQLTSMETMLVDKISQINDLKNELEAIQQKSQQSGRMKPQETAVQGREAVELPPVVVYPRQDTADELTTKATITIPSEQEALAEAPKFRGSVLTVNKESNFVVVDLGENAGIKVGATFQVDRGGEPVAIIEVIKVSKSVSACDIKEQKSPIKVGDIIY
ncbi:MAG: hypothetical protein V1925_03955 [Candidatus Omnitrophota bacterium]